MLGDDNAINALARPIAALGACGVSRHEREPAPQGAGRPPLITGVLERPPLLKRNISEMSQLMGGAKALVLFDESEVSRTAVAHEFKARGELRVGQTRVSSRQFTDYRRWQEAVLTSQQNGYQALFLGLYPPSSTTGRHVDEQQVLAWTSSPTARCPVLLQGLRWGRSRTIGGLVLDGHTRGKAAELANAILAGTAPGPSPRAALRGEYLFSKSELARWQPDGSRCLAGQGDLASSEPTNDKPGQWAGFVYQTCILRAEWPPATRLRSRW